MRTLIASALIVLAASVSATAAPIVSKTGKVSVELPASWKTQAKGDTLLVAADAKKEIGVVFMITDPEATEATLAELRKAVGAKLKGETWEAPSQLTLNGMTGLAIEGSGMMSDKKAALSVIILETPAKKHVVLFGAVQADKEAAHAKEIEGILKSLKPTK